ncbi:MAG: hypothetical protein RLZZ241_1415 [Bacteroidota bacterium]|jgi:hypothetical protein
MPRFLELLLIVLCLGCKTALPVKVNGVSFVAAHEAVSKEHIRPLLEINASYAAVMPYGFIPEPDTAKIIFDADRQLYGETRDGALQYINLLHESGVLVMLKPQLWIWRGLFTGNLKMATEADWEALEKQYSAFILAFADVAAQTGVDLFCIGTELKSFVRARPEYWSELIDQIRLRYPGKLTYASNWDEYLEVPFWEKLDYIGIDAYFPLSEAQTPSVSALQEAWIPWKSNMQELALRIERPVLFTEYGYRSVDHTARQPWQANRISGQVNLKAQANANTAILEAFWNEPWFAGGFVWKWFINHPLSGGHQDNRFTPQNKPAQQVIRKYYGSRRR